jgi:hypothetical protein
MDAQLYFLKSWDIEAELKTSDLIIKKKHPFSLSVSIWEDRNLDANELRAQAWNRNR